MHIRQQSNDSSYSNPEEGMLLMKCIFRKDQLVMEHLITLYHEDWDPTLPSAQFVWQPCGSYIFGCCLSVSLHWSCIMILWM
ncbi:hypothetical protein CY35_19G027800 [Sphagnum magellanicum]|nr:hypothetical protein CY35_19G027800 [Sphagnum magellanicum]